jgi:uncharacterized membrane protein (DUF4010 family)
MQQTGEPLLNLVIALGAGLLIGAERERRKFESGARQSAGMRTFAIAALSGALSIKVGGVGLLAMTVLIIGAMAGLGYWRTRDAEDPGITTEIALVATVLIGALAVPLPEATAAAAVAVTFLLAARKGMHHFVGSVLTEEEMRSALVLAAAAIVVPPLLPNAAMGPFGALNPFKIWRLVVLVLAIGAFGHMAVRILGPKYGLPVAGLASGFISSSATIGAMGARAAKSPALLGLAVSGAVLSTVATVVQMAAVVGATSAAALRQISGSLIVAGAAAGLYGLGFTVMALRQKSEAGHDATGAFSLGTALKFALLLTTVLLVSAAMREWFGEAGAVVAAALAGFADTHAPAISIAALVDSGKMTPQNAVIPILAAFTANTITKVVVARAAGGRAFAIRVIPGLLLVAAGAWVGTLLRIAP